jgi:hypothetical protein
MACDEEDDRWYEIQENEMNLYLEEVETVEPVLDVGNVIESTVAMQQCSIEELQAVIGRHERGDWGDSPDDWINSNRKALRTGQLVRSFYRLDSKREVCIETDAVCQRECCRRRHLTHVFVPYEDEVVSDLLGDRLAKRFERTDPPLSA